MIDLCFESKPLGTLPARQGRLFATEMWKAGSCVLQAPSYMAGTSGSGLR